jgi:hypothetical protein
MDEFIRRWFQFYNQVYLFHWQATSYARHEAYDETLEELGDLVDSFVEAYQGKYGRISIGVSAIEVGDTNLANEEGFVASYRDFLDNDVREIAELDSDNDLTALLDEMVILLNKLLYLQTLS